jgi:hypothetical protein
MMTKTGLGKFSVMSKSADGIIEEWKMCFSDAGLVMVSHLAF